MNRSISLDDFIALSDEIRALARAGVPLDKGLVALAEDLPGRLGQHAKQLGDSLSEGVSLAGALETLGPVPSAYRAIVTAGLKSGRLAAALQGIIETSRRAAEARRTTTIALLYQVVTLAAASAVFIISVNYTVPVVSRVFDDFELNRPSWYNLQLAVSAWTAPLLPWCWAAAILAWLLAWCWSRRTAALYDGGLGWMPGARSLVRHVRLAAFTDMLALLIEQRLPLAESMQLAADSSGDKHLQVAAVRMSEQIRNGQAAPRAAAGMPPLLAWLLLSGCSPDVLVKSLRDASVKHRRIAADNSNWIGFYLPMLISVGLCGTFALFYALFVLGPVYHILRQIGGV